MKKMFCAIIALAIVFSLCACGTPDITISSDSNTQTSAPIGIVPDKKLVNITDYEALLYARPE